MDKLLYITKTFSSLSPGRTAKYEKFFAFLLSRGVGVHVLTSLEPGTPDYSSWKSRGLHVKFVGYPIYLYKKHIFKKAGGKKAEKTGEAQVRNIGDPGSKNVLRRMLFALFRKLRTTLIKKKTFLIPDNYADWMLCSLPAAFRIVKRERIRLVITACFPYSAHVLGTPGLQILCGADQIWSRQFPKSSKD